MTETVTPVKFRAGDGVVYERTGEKREPQPGELHWCEATRPAPYAFRWPKRTRWSPNGFWAQPEGTTKEQWPCKHCGRPKAMHEGKYAPLCPRFHKCAIWKVSEDQGWQPPASVAPASQDPIDQLIQRVQLTGGDLEGANIPVLAVLYQAKHLEQIAKLLQTAVDNLLIRNVPAILPFAPRPATNADLSAVGAYVCSNCQGDEHGNCLAPANCFCVACHAAPTHPGYREEYTAGVTFQTLRHRFEGMVDNHFCTQCGGGRLHPIHQIA